MRKFILSLSLIIAFFFLLVNSSLASDNNIFGLHLTQTSDIHQAKDYINSSGGDWGWATIVIRLDLLDHNNWQEFMNNCRKYHIIPIIRLGTIMDQGSWRRPSYSDIDQLASFLNNLNWPTKKQHVILFNEINHGSEWGGSVDIKNYTDSAIYASQKFKEKNQDFVVMGAGLDLAAPDINDKFASAQTVYQTIYNYKPEYFNQMDALASHSYPNHGYIALPEKTGQTSIRGYDWELNFIKNLGVTKSYPIFITETGWPHREGESKNNAYYTVKTSADFLSKAYTIWNNDNRVIATTPFIFNYPYEPFDHFSWLTKNGQLYPEYQQIINLPKKQNHPEQKTSYQLVSINLPLLIIHDTEYQSNIILKNNGQSIWGETKFCLDPNTSPDITTDKICVGDQSVEPGQSQKINFKFIIKDIESDSSFIGWDSLEVKEIEPVILKGQIYRPKTGFKDKLIQFFYNLFGQFLVK